MLVEVALVLGHDRDCVALVDDEDPVEEFAADAASAACAGIVLILFLRQKHDHPRTAMITRDRRTSTTAGHKSCSQTRAHRGQAAR
jgi:hypothetical protein